MRILFIVIMLGVVFVSGASPQSPQSSRQISVMPMPSVVQFGTGRLLIAPSFSVGMTGHTEPRLERAAQRFLHQLSLQTGMPLPERLANTSKATLVLQADRAGKPVQDFDEEESYTLDVSSSGAKLKATTPLGILRGLQTFLQLVKITPNGFAAAVVHVEDKPRFPWRGLLIDSCRHFVPLDVLKRNIDGMEAVKMNVLHWHLSENQGFRVESRTFPKLHELGSDGLYYTQAQVREIIEYARDRGIRVVPEFDVPGHSTAWFVGYPELASGPGPYAIERKWGIFDPAMDPTREQTYKFLDKFFGEMARLFSDPYFHIGGDEVNGKQWDANPAIQAFLHARNLKGNRDLQQYFNTRVQEILRKHHKIMLGWDEILSPELPKDVVIQSWRGQASLADAAKQGYRGLLSYGYYLDLMWPAYRHYAVDPMEDGAATLSPEERQRILGGEACMWSEFVSAENMDSRIWPRAAAVAERLWSPQQVQDVDSMYRRLDAVSRRLEWIGLTHRTGATAMLTRLAGTDDIAALRVLTDVVEPVKDYTREHIASSAGVVQTSADPLNRLVDSVPPESETARRFADDIDALVAGKFRDAEAKVRVRALLASWQGNQTQLQPLLDRSFLLKEVTPLSQDLASLGTAGLQALDGIEKGERAPETWKQEQLAMIEQAKKPKADLLLMVAAAVQKLIEARGGSDEKK